MIDRIYRITVVGDSSWRVERPVSHPNPNSLNSVNSVNTVSKTKERIYTELESSMGSPTVNFKSNFRALSKCVKLPNISHAKFAKCAKLCFRVALRT